MYGCRIVLMLSSSGNISFTKELLRIYLYASPQIIKNKAFGMNNYGRNNPHCSRKNTKTPSSRSKKRRNSRRQSNPNPSSTNNGKKQSCLHCGTQRSPNHLRCLQRNRTADAKCNPLDNHPSTNRQDRKS